MSEEDEQLRGLPRDLLQDIKRAQYEAKVRAMEDEARRHSEPPCPWGPPETCKWGDACADCGRNGRVGGVR